MSSPTNDAAPISRREALAGAAAGLLTLSTGAWVPPSGSADAFSFSSFPDFFNWDIPYPQPGYEAAITWFIETMKTQGAEFGLVAGDLMDARWRSSPGQARQHALAYWGGWVSRMENHDFPCYVVPGDHERGDNPVKPELVPAFERAFREVFGMPGNGPSSKEGLAYYFTKGDTLFVGVDTFTLQGRSVKWAVEGEQLAWFRQVLADHQDVAHIIVQGHVPVLPKVSHRRSSKIVLAGGKGRKTAFWKAMVEGGVDVYLCGEHHDITVTRRDGIWQVVHGSIWGGLSPVNYLLGRIDGDTLRLELKEFPLTFSGDEIWHLNRAVGRRPQETVTVPAAVKRDGPASVGTLVRRGDEDVTRTGHFR